MAPITSFLKQGHSDQDACVGKFDCSDAHFISESRFGFDVSDAHQSEPAARDQNIRGMRAARHAWQRCETHRLREATNFQTERRICVLHFAVWPGIPISILQATN